MVVKIFIVVIVNFLMLPLWSQSIYLEGLGKGFVNSLSYEHPIAKDKLGLNLQVGFGFAPSSLITAPVSISKIFGKKSHHLELGAGLTFFNGILWVDDDSLGPDIIFHISAYYRFQKQAGRFYYKLGFTPIISRHFSIAPWFGAGLGYVLKI